MKKIVTYALIGVMTLYAQVLTAQEDQVAKKIEVLKQQKESVVSAEKAELKKKVEQINERLAKEEISLEEATALKEVAAKKHALNIENTLNIIDNKIALIERNGIQEEEGGPAAVEIGIGSQDKDGEILLGINVKTGKKKEKYDKRTYSDLVLAFGLNNTITDGQSLDDSDYKIAGSRFFELGYAWTTRVLKESNVLRVKYGFSFQFNGLKPTGNRYFVENGDQTELQDFGVELKKSKFRVDNLVIPVHFEFGPSKITKTDEKIRYSTHRKFRVGLGGYVGANISTRQKLKYEENGENVKDKIKRDYNTSNLVYGLSSYIGFGDMTLYAKYDISPVFKNANMQQNNVSLGLRFDL